VLYNVPMVRIEDRWYLDIPELTDWLGIHRNTVYNWIAKGMPCERFGWQLLFRYKEIRQWVKEYRGCAPPDLKF